MGPGQAHQLPGRVGGIRQPAQDRGDLAVTHLVGEAVAAEQEAVAFVGEDLPHVGLDVGPHAQHPGEDVALGVGGGLVGAELALPDQVLHQAVVLGEPAQFPLLEQVGARVAHVDDDEALLPVHLHQRHRGQRRPHPPEVGVVLGSIPDGRVGPAGGFDQPVRAPVLLERLAERPDGRERRHLSAPVAAHAVGHREEGLGDDEVVLVVAAHATGVGRRAEAERGHEQLTLSAPARCARPAPGPRGAATRGR